MSESYDSEAVRQARLEADSGESDTFKIVVPPLLDGVRTGGPRTIVRPLEKLRAKYYAAGRASCYASRDFELYIWQRASLPGWCDRVEGADLYATLLMRSAVRSIEVDALMAAVVRIEKALAQVTDDDLARADLAKLQVPLTALFKACRAKGFSIAKVTKLLCQKRPHLIPMLDSQVLTALGGPWPTSRDPDIFARDAVCAVNRFRSLMRWSDGSGQDNLAVLGEVARIFTDELSAFLTSERLDKPHPQFTTVRILDNLLWFDWGGGAYWRYGLNGETGTFERNDGSEVGQPEAAG